MRQKLNWAVINTSSEIIIFELLAAQKHSKLPTDDRDMGHSVSAIV